MLVGLLATAAVPIGVVFSRWVGNIKLIDAAIAIPIAAVLGVVAIVLARRSRRAIEWTIGRAGGRRAARLGWFLGVLALCLAAAAGLALGFYGLLVLLGE